MRPAHAVRGAAIAETALVLTATLAMVFGIIQIGIIGYLQLTVDGAAFIAAHEYALGNKTTFATVARRPFPLAGTFYIDNNTPDATTVAVNFHTDLTTQRHGGVSLVRTSHLQATVTKNAPGGLLGVGIAALSNVGVHGSAIEPYNLVSNNAYDVNANGYSGTPSSQLDFYSNVQNAPANYISQHEMAVCRVSTTNPVSTFGASCPGSKVAIVSLGTGVFLDHDNWQRTNLGIGTYGSGYTFGEFLCHQQMYALALSQFPNATSNAELPSNVSMTDTSTTVGKIYSWDYLTSLGGGYTFNETAYGLSPMHPEKFCP